MLRSAVFSKAAAIGILANGLGPLYFLALAFAPAIIWLPPTLSAPFRLVWYVLSAFVLDASLPLFFCFDLGLPLLVIFAGLVYDKWIGGTSQ